MMRVSFTTMAVIIVFHVKTHNFLKKKAKLLSEYHFFI